MRKPQFYSVFLFLFFAHTCFSQSTNPLIAENFKEQKIWVDSIYENMTLQEKVGQLFMVDVFSNQTGKNIEKVRDLIKDYHIGGIIFSKGGPQRQAKLNNEFQALSKMPLLIGMDAEWGLAMRLDSTFALPWNMTLGAVQDLKLIEEAGAAISRNSKRLGVHINFAPVVDINTNPLNPIIGNRSFGEEKINVALKSVSFMRGMHKEGILSSAKHFPGHGDTKKDSHKTLPTISFSKSRLDSIELYPFKKLIEEGVSSIMVAHLNVPGLETQETIPSSLSKAIVNDLLKKELKFNGLIFTDALNMKGASNYKNPGEIDLAAFMAGNDILLISEDVPKAVDKVMEAYNDGTISEARMAHSVRKILFAKYKAGLNNYKPVDTTNLVSELNTVEDLALYDKLIENAITIIKNDVGNLPIKELDTKKIAYVSLGDDDGAPFYHHLSKYGQIDRVRATRLDELLEKLKNYNQVIIGYHKSNASPWARYAFSAEELNWIHEIARNNTTILDVFARPYALMDLNSSSNIEGILMSYQNSEAAQRKSAEIIFGALGAKGRLPVSISEAFPAGTGYYTKSVNRLSYGYPEAVGMNSYKLQKIDSLINLAISEEMTPGLQLIVARKGKVIFERNAGYHTYEKTIKVTDSSVYDLASLTKILASLPLIMELEEKGELKFNSKLGDLMPFFKGSNKANIKLQDMLMHYAKLKPWIPFYISTIDKDTKGRSVKYYRDEPMDIYNTKIADKMFIRDDLRDSIMGVIRDSKLEPKLVYKYSDLPFYIMKYFIEDHYNSSLSYLVKEHFYDALGANTITYLPLATINENRIVPTEYDKLWRKQEVLGYVHDQGAAMQGGIGGHAGLFSNATDVAKIMQMYLNGGNYGGKQYFEQETLDKFNTCYYCKEDVRRGVGFDKPQLGKAGPTCGCVSLSSFGHTGFTGTLAWADPDKEIVYVFLSNRTYPDVNNRKLIREDIREKIQQIIYESIED
ncbi:beta-glucosidase-like glycosyl hydrolase [Gillisia sp. Hel_I_86]|uniref:glycoside hydrolase family 3 N-terminal domain-containing protein n=1 Tax=Gillisia sp. Hel_I_86 TaxID=1249981 RepID=UPI001199E78E|nr:glycoside hydrolase family 3 N-terminal domain-containing protein [Gillisia sp. Hel_I_86]TVZ28251.1 beta-glucosidase-like glycosyl hydrolase [Gillisia sp. Hel_I_86]